MLGGISSRSFTGRQSLDRSVENPPAFIPLGGAQAWPLTGVRGSESGMARVCESKELSLER